MAAEDWIPDYAFEDPDWCEPDPNDGIYFYKSPFRHTCKYCGAKNLMWVQVKQKWKLFSKDKQQHQCKQHDS